MLLTCQKANVKNPTSSFGDAFEKCFTAKLTLPWAKRLCSKWYNMKPVIISSCIFDCFRSCISAFWSNNFQSLWFVASKIQYHGRKRIGCHAKHSNDKSNPQLWQEASPTVPKPAIFTVLAANDIYISSSCFAALEPRLQRVKEVWCPKSVMVQCCYRFSLPWHHRGSEGWQDRSGNTVSARQL